MWVYFFQLTLVTGKSSAFQPPYQAADTFESVEAPADRVNESPEGAAYAAGRESRERNVRVLA